MRSSLLQRSTACLVALSVALFSLEAAVADVHDGHGSRPAVTADDGGTHPGAPAAGRETQQHDAPRDGGHPMHVCHCMHGHTAGSSTGRVSVSLAPLRLLAPDGLPAQVAPSRAQEPLIRPPIA